MSDAVIYRERLTSARTEALFVALAAIFLGLFFRRFAATGLRGWSVVWLCLSAMFCFYVLNYRVLVVILAPDRLTLRFGLLRWPIPLTNIADCYLDQTSLWRIGGAGIHFSWFRGRYRAMFNFLEYPRVVVRLRRKRGMVQEAAFSTRQPDQVMSRLSSMASMSGKGEDE